jgi:molecular chaperone GrpE
MNDEKKSESTEEIPKDTGSAEAGGLEDNKTVNNPDGSPETDKTAEESEEESGKETRGERKKIKRLESEIEGLKKQLADSDAAASAANDKYLRMLAEYDNYRKRSLKEKESSYNDAYADAVTLILPVLDNLERASKYTDVESVTKGIELILKNLNETLDKLGIKAIGEAGVKFDPNIHYAVMHVEDEKFGENEVAEILQKGYMKCDKVIRHAMVRVAN